MKPLYSPEALALEKHLFETPNHHAYAIVDGAAIPDLLPMITGYSISYRCLFQGELTPQLAASSPYLIKLQSFTNVTDWLVSAQGTHQQIFALLPDALEFEAVYKHFRTFLRVRDPNNKMLYFRFYDPRILHVFLTNCTPQEAQFVYGPVHSYLAEGTQHKSPNTLNQPESNANNSVPRQQTLKIHPTTLLALKENKRKQFCNTCLHDLKEDNLPVDPADAQQQKTFFNLSKQLDTMNYASQNLQYRFFTLFTLLGPMLLQDKHIMNTLKSAHNDDERQDLLNFLIQSIHQGGV
jgi:hypothetical protein